MSSLSGVLERYRLQTLNLPPDKLVHTLIPEQTGAAEATSVLYKKKSGSAGRLGGGSFGAVHLESSESDCEAAPKLRAVKTISKAIAKECSVLWQQEIENLIVLSKFPELFVNIFGWWEDDKSIYLPMEYFEAGDLSRYKESIRDENEIRAISHQIALGLEKMHALGIIHRDLKPQNVFVATLQPAWKVKIGDFGFSKRISASVSAPYTICGTTKYMAPEYADPSNNRESSDFTVAVDMWSFGCLIYELFVHKCPFEEEDNSLKRYIKHKVFPRQPLERREASNESIWLISKLLEPDPDRRLPAEDALKCAWFDVESMPATDRQLRRKPVKPLKTTPDALPKLQADVEPAPPAFVVSVAAEDENQTAVSSIHALHRPDLSNRAITVPTMTLDHIALVPDESIPKSSVPPPLSPRLPPRPKSTNGLRADAERVHANGSSPLSPRLPPRPKSSNALRADAEKVHAKPHFVILPHDDPETSAVEVEVIKPDMIEMPKSPCPMLAKSRRTVIPAPSLRLTKKGDNCVDMDFKDLPLNSRPKPMCDMCEARRVFNPVIKPAALYFCKDCDHRPLCARCIRETISSSGDPHEADHKLQAWIQGHILPFASFSENSLAMTTLESGLQADYGRSWMSSDRAFVPPTGGQLTTRFTMYAPPGEYKVSIDFRTLKCGEAIRSSTIGHYNAMIVKKAKAVKLGSILLGAQTVEKLDSPAKEDPAHSRYLPEQFREHEVIFTEEEDPQTITLGRLVRVEPGRFLEVHIRGSYDSVFFKAGSPFKWWLDEISILHTGPEEHVASMGDRKMREDFKKQQARLLKSQKIQKNMGLVSQSIDVAGKVGRFIPGARYLSNVASGAVKLSATAMKDPQGKTQGMHSAPQIVHNHYVITNDTPSTHQWQQEESEYENQPEYEEPDDQGYYAEDMTYYQEQVEFYQEDAGQPQLMEEVAGANAGGNYPRSNSPGGGVFKTVVFFSDELTPRHKWTFNGPNFFFAAAIRTGIKQKIGPAINTFTSAVWNIIVGQAFAQHSDGSITLGTTNLNRAKCRFNPRPPQPTPFESPLANLARRHLRRRQEAILPSDLAHGSPMPDDSSGSAQTQRRSVTLIVAEPEAPPLPALSNNLTTCGGYCSVASDCGPGGDSEDDRYCAVPSSLRDTKDFGFGAHCDRFGLSGVGAVWMLKANGIDVCNATIEVVGEVKVLGDLVAEVQKMEDKAPASGHLSSVMGGDDPEAGVDTTDIERIERVYRKLDRRIIPAFWVLYFLCSAIRSNVGLSQTMNEAQHHSLKEVLHLTPKQVSTGLALFYVCYVVFDLPSNLIMTRLSPRVWMSRIVIGVGVIGSCMAAMKAAWSLYLLRLLLGIVIAGMWPGMAYYLTLFYPPSRTGKRIGQYFTAAQVSAAVVGLVSAGFQKMDGLGGLVGFQWMFLLYGLVGILVGFSLLWWLPDRPLPPGEVPNRTGWHKWVPQSKPALTGEDALIHYRDLTRVYHRSRWGVKDLWHVVIDWRVWPLLLMYFGVVGVGIGVQNYATVIIQSTNSKLTSIDLSLLTAPIWIMDLIAILLVTPFSDRFHHHRALFFSVPVCIQIAGLLLTTYGGSAANPWPRYGGLLMVGFGLGPTVPITMTWTNEIFQPRHGEVGVAAASALVSGLGNLGSILTTYALFTGWPADSKSGRKQYRKSTLVMVGILCLSILSAFVMTLLLKFVGNGPRAKEVSSRSSTNESEGVMIDGAAKRELQERGFGRLWWSRR